jgi:hypothetical protein
MGLPVLVEIEGVELNFVVQEEETESQDLLP